MVDTYSKWIGMGIVGSTTFTATTDKLKTVFATYGVLETLVLNNGRAFTSLEFQVFLKQNGIFHICTVPYLSLIHI